MLHVLVVFITLLRLSVPTWATPDLQLTNPVVEGENATFSISPVDKTCYWRLNQEKLGDRFKQVDVMWVQQADGISKASNWTATREDNGSVFMASCGSLTTNNVTLIVNPAPLMEDVPGVVQQVIVTPGLKVVEVKWDAAEERGSAITSYTVTVQNQDRSIEKNVTSGTSATFTRDELGIPGDGDTVELTIIIIAVNGIGPGESYEVVRDVKFDPVVSTTGTPPTSVSATPSPSGSSTSSLPSSLTLLLPFIITYIVT